MPLTLEQYATFLDTRGDLSWPVSPEVERPKAKPHLVALPVKAVLWNVYGTLLSIGGGELLFEHPNDFVMSVALDKTIAEFKMWSSMSRKPGAPSEYMRSIYAQLLLEQRTGPPNERFPEVASEKVWDAVIKRLLQKDYKFDAGFYGSLNEFSRKVAYFFHASLQGTSCYPDAAFALRNVREAGLKQAVLGDGQCFTMLQLQRGLKAQDGSIRVEDLLDDAVNTLSFDVRGRKPSERLFRHALAKLAEQGITPSEVLHVGSRVGNDLVPARRLGMRTALFAGDRASLQATAEQVRDPGSKPDVLLTELSQIADIVDN
jgi:FMN phosphatase YigB (HAD superfamily)